MFDSLKHWFDSLKIESKLFEHADDEGLHAALASVLYHIIAADNHVDSREKHEFDRILKQEFDLDQDQVEHLYAAVKGFNRGSARRSPYDQFLPEEKSGRAHELHAKAAANRQYPRHPRR